MSGNEQNIRQEARRRVNEALMIKQREREAREKQISTHAVAVLTALAGRDAAVAEADGLQLRGVMAVAPLGAGPRPAFARLAALSAGLRTEHPDAGWISAGMSGDLVEAVAEGATHVRVGTALLGRRPPLSR